MGTPPAPLDQLRLMFCLVPAVSPNLPRPPYLSTTLRRVSLPSMGPSCSTPGLLGGKKEGAGWWVTPQRGTPRRGTPSHAPAFLLFPPAPQHLAEDSVQLPPHPHTGPPQSPHPSIFRVPAPLPATQAATLAAQAPVAVARGGLGPLRPPWTYARCWPRGSVLGRAPRRVSIRPPHPSLGAAAAPAWPHWEAPRKLVPRLG